jgi:DNA-binding NtrC family response regulator
VIQEKRVRRVGGSDETPVDVRIIASTHRDLLQMVREGAFREDLYYRVDVIQVPIPPLRERLEDIPLLVAEFSSRLFRQGGVPKRIFSPAALSAFLRHSWPGNVRELENVVERSLTLAEGDTVGPEDLSLATPLREDSLPDPYPGFSLSDFVKETVRRTETQMVRRAMELSEGRRTEAARLLGLTERSLKYLLSKNST